MSSVTPGRGPTRRLRAIPRRAAGLGRSWWSDSLINNARVQVRELDLNTHALALCAQQVLCTAPLVVAMSAVLQREADEGMSGVTAKFFGLHHEAATAVTDLLGRASGSISTAALIFSLVTAVVFSTSVGAVQQRAFELIWSVPRATGIRPYLRQLVWAVVLGVFCLGMLFAGKLGHAANRHLIHTGFITALVLRTSLIFVFYLWSQHWLLGGRVLVADLLAGASAIALATAVMFRVSRVIIPQQIIWQTHAYGLIGVAFVLSAWLMVLCLVIFVGALSGALWSQRAAERRAGATEAVREDDVAITAEVVILSGFDSDEPSAGFAVHDAADASNSRSVTAGAAEGAHRHAARPRSGRN